MIPIDITLLGIEIDCNDVHDANAEYPIIVIFLKLNEIMLYIWVKTNIFYTTRYSYRCKSIDIIIIIIVINCV